MPIRPEMLARYPADWQDIRARIQRRARNRCEGCGVKNHALGGRDDQGRFLLAVPHDDRPTWPKPGVMAWCQLGARNEILRIIRIVCTVAHLDHIPEHCDDDNLKFWCQQCHNRHDAPMRAAGIRERRARDAGQAALAL